MGGRRTRRRRRRKCSFPPSEYRTPILQTIVTVKIGGEIGGMVDAEEIEEEVVEVIIDGEVVVAVEERKRRTPLSTSQILLHSPLSKEIVNSFNRCVVCSCVAKW